MKQLKIWLEAIRLRTLPVSLSGVLIAIGFAQWEGNLHDRALPAIVCLAFALMAQIVSNLANEYYDYKHGTDKVGRDGPRRGVTEGDIKPATMRNVTFALLAVTCAVGCLTLPFVEADARPWLIVAGLLIALFAFAYSAGPFPLSHHGLGEMTVFIFYGLVPVNLTYFVIANHFDGFTCLASIAIGLMGVNVLLVNNYRDADDDADVGKRTSVVIFGRPAAALAYALNGFTAMAILTPLWLWAFFHTLWLMLLIPALYLILHIVLWLRLSSSTGKALNPVLGLTAANMLLFTLLLIAALWHNPYFG